ncbi:MAG: hypothetical protein WKF57_15295 [Nakamurella sp.]
MTESTVGSSSPDRPIPRSAGRFSGLFLGTVAPNGAALAIAVTVLSLWWWRATEQLIEGAAGISWRIQLLDLALALGAGLVIGLAVCVGARFLRRRTALWLPWSVVTAAILVYTMGGGASLIGWLIVAAAVLIGAGLLGASAAGLQRQRRSAWVSGGVGALLVALVVGYLIWPGPGAQPAPVPVATGSPASPEATDPGVGTGQVAELRYGSGRPGIEPSYASGLTFTSDPVDASGLLQGWGADTSRTSVWGFDASQLPIQGLLFVPAGSEPAPLVVIVHGNSLFAGSERGFGYLARALAARGYVVAAIDENFLSTGLLDKSDPIGGAGITRAWLVLQHVHQLLGWSAGIDTALSGRIDPRQVALVGHSRGGEAVAVAAALSRAIGTVPGTQVPVPSDVDIRTVVALAPSDGQTEVDGKPVQLTDIDYLTVGGTLDADVGTFAGALQYARVIPGEGRVKAAVLIDRANHTQFNENWGRQDLGQGAAADLLSTGVLLPAAEQRQATIGLVGSFLDLTVRRMTQYRSVFDGSAASPGWLPATTYLRQFSDGDGAGLQTWSADDATSHPLGTVTVQGATASVAAVPTSRGPSTDKALRMDVTAAEASWTVAGLRQGDVGGDATVSVSVAGTAPDAAIGIRLRMLLRSGATVDVTPTPYAALPGVLSSETLKPLLPGGRGGEPTFVTYAASAAALESAGVDTTQVTGFSVVFTGAAGQQVYLDDVGIR